MLEDNFCVDIVVFLKSVTVNCLTNNFAFHNIKEKQSTKEEAFKFLIYAFRSSLCFLKAKYYAWKMFSLTFFIIRGLTSKKPIIYKYSLIGITIIAIIIQQKV